MRQLKFYPAAKIKTGSEADETLRVLADHEADTGNVPQALQTYQQSLDRLETGGAKPEASLEDAVDLSHIWASMAGLHRPVGHTDLASVLDSRRLELWRQWGASFPTILLYSDR